MFADVRIRASERFLSNKNKDENKILLQCYRPCQSGPEFSSWNSKATNGALKINFCLHFLCNSCVGSCFNPFHLFHYSLLISDLKAAAFADIENDSNDEKSSDVSLRKPMKANNNKQKNGRGNILYNLI